MNALPYIIAVDFDGTLCEECYPEIGAPNLRIINELINRQKSGTRIILWTCRAGVLLDNAITFCESHGLIFDAINDNIPEILHFYKYASRKVSANEYWDDKAVAIEYIEESDKSN